MTLPTQVTIGPIMYTVTEVDRLTDEGKDMLGMIEYNQARIRIERDMPDAVKLVTLVHECVHGVLHHAGVKHSEGVVQAISYGLVDLFERNGWTIDLGDA